MPDPDVTASTVGGTDETHSEFHFTLPEGQIDIVGSGTLVNACRSALQNTLEQYVQAAFTQGVGRLTFEAVPTEPQT